jgi:hypothetical protein
VTHVGPFPWGGEHNGTLNFVPISVPAQQACRWYWLHRKWAFNVFITDDTTGAVIVSGTDTLEWNYRARGSPAGLVPPPTQKEQLGMGYQMYDLLTGLLFTVDFFSSNLGSSAGGNSGVEYVADMSVGIKPYILIQGPGAGSITSTGVQLGTVTGSIDGVGLPFSSFGVSGTITMDPIEDWFYP